jgi:hypothetical protein
LKSTMKAQCCQIHKCNLDLTRNSANKPQWACPVDTYTCVRYCLSNA